MAILWVALGSAIGGAGRYAVSGVMARLVGETFPWGTLTVNVVGSLLITLIASLSGPDGRLYLSPAARQVMLLGVLGGFTTFSSFSIQTLALAQDGEWLRAWGNVIGSVVLCLSGAWLGHMLATVINR
ncbi:MAG: fluoride efflux transporter CrcB [Kiloniellales bacterium]